LKTFIKLFKKHDPFTLKEADCDQNRVYLMWGVLISSCPNNSGTLKHYLISYRIDCGFVCMYITIYQTPVQHHISNITLYFAKQTTVKVIKRSRSNCKYV